MPGRAVLRASGLIMGLGLAEVVMGIEEQLDLTFPEEAPLVWNTGTVGDLVDCTSALYRRQHPTDAPGALRAAEIERRVTAIVAAVAGRSPSEIGREQRLLADLHLGD
jgi:hypothetical protein